MRLNASGFFFYLCPVAHATARPLLKFVCLFVTAIQGALSKLLTKDPSSTTKIAAIVRMPFSSRRCFSMINMFGPLQSCLAPKLSLPCGSSKRIQPSGRS